jgi:hypothetical protein
MIPNERRARYTEWIVSSVCEQQAERPSSIQRNPYANFWLDCVAVHARERMSP